MKKIFIWGTGKICKDLLPLLREIEILGFVETVPAKSVFQGKKVIAPDKIQNCKYDILLVAVAKAGEIERIIGQLGINFSNVVFWNLEPLKKRSQAYRNYKLLEPILEGRIYHAIWEEQAKYVEYDPEFLKENYGKMGFEISDLMECISKNGYVQRFNYPYIDEYLDNFYHLQRNQENSLYKVDLEQGSIYYPGDFKRNGVISFLVRDLVHMDSRSPVCFQLPFHNKEKMILLEVGVKSGIYAVKNIDVFEKVFLIESNNRWHRALQKTFREQLGEKVFLLKSISDLKQSEAFSTCRKAIKERGLLKVDVGLNCDLVDEALQMMEDVNIKYFAGASYYSDEIEEKFRNMFSEQGWKLWSSEGYIYYPLWKNQGLKRGVMFAERKIKWGKGK